MRQCQNTDALLTTPYWRYDMAAIKGTHPPLKHTRQDFPEIKGKIVESVELFANHDHYGITIRCKNRTTLTFRIETCAVVFPVYSKWKGGEEKPLMRYKPLRSKVRT
jgi:hypothetical protein